MTAAAAGEHQDRPGVTERNPALDAVLWRHVAAGELLQPPVLLERTGQGITALGDSRPQPPVKP